MPLILLINLWRSGDTLSANNYNDFNILAYIFELYPQPYPQ